MALDKQTIDLIKKYAIKNAIDYGKADVGSVLGKIIPNAKGVPIPELRKEVEAVIKSVNKMKKSELEKEYAPFVKEFEKKAEETVKKTEKPKLELEGAVIGKFATRWPPEPSGYLHVGHAKPIFLEDEFRKIYNGKLFLYFDDTNPEKEKQEYVDAGKKDLEWLGIKFDKEYYASDNLEKIYDYAKKLIKDGHAYVCACDQETAKKKRLAMEECEHRKRTIKENVAEFEKMLASKYEEGEAVLRFKGDMHADNTVLRDPTIARIKKMKHYRQGTKYCVWPTYDLAAPIMDSVNGVTHVLRSKEYELRDELDTTILKLLGLRVPIIQPFSRFNIKGNTTHKREIRKLISDGIIKDWDDPRLMTFIALRRRGIMPEAIRALVMKTGITKTDSILPLDMLLAENKSIIEPIAVHLFFVEDPVELTLKGEIPKTVKMPTKRDSKLFREYKIGSRIYISKKDLDKIKKDEIIRLKELIDVKVGKDKIAEVDDARAVREPKIIQWVPESGHLKCTVIVPGTLLNDNDEYNHDSLRTVEGYVESYADQLKEHEIVQFERFGYCILDDKKKMQFIFISK